jgi:hypothetical protein
MVDLFLDVHSFVAVRMDHISNLPPWCGHPLLPELRLPHLPELRLPRLFELHRPPEPSLSFLVVGMEMELFLRLPTVSDLACRLNRLNQDFLRLPYVPELRLLFLVVVVVLVEREVEQRICLPNLRNRLDPAKDDFLRFWAPLCKAFAASVARPVRESQNDQIKSRMATTTILPTNLPQDCRFSTRSSSQLRQSKTAQPSLELHGGVIVVVLP